MSTSKKAELRSEVLRLAKYINAPEELIPTFDYSIDFGYPHIELKGNEYHFVVVERGQELERRKTFHLNEILFWIFDGITFSMATELELRNRNNEEDFRIQLFKYQEDLMSKINPEFSRTLKVRHTQILGF